MKVDVLHEMTDDRDPSKPCGEVAMTLLYPISPGAVLQPRDLAWPRLRDDHFGAVLCGSCGDYAGASMAQETCRPHVCVLIRLPGADRLHCRAGCS